VVGWLIKKRSRGEIRWRWLFCCKRPPSWRIVQRAKLTMRAQASFFLRWKYTFKKFYF
jgi:hypothetical protein